NQASVGVPPGLIVPDKTTLVNVAPVAASVWPSGGPLMAREAVGPRDAAPSWSDRRPVVTTATPTRPAAIGTRTMQLEPALRLKPSRTIDRVPGTANTFPLNPRVVTGPDAIVSNAGSVLV